MESIEDILKRVKQEVFDEMVEGNGRQPAEVVDMVCYALRDAGFGDYADYREVLDFYPDYSKEV